MAEGAVQRAITTRAISAPSMSFDEKKDHAWVWYALGEEKEHNEWIPATVEDTFPNYLEKRQTKNYVKEKGLIRKTSIRRLQTCSRICPCLRAHRTLRPWRDHPRLWERRRRIHQYSDEESTFAAWLPERFKCKELWCDHRKSDWAGIHKTSISWWNITKHKDKTSE